VHLNYEVFKKNKNMQVNSSFSFLTELQHSTYLRNKDDSFKWALVVVYGPAQDDQKQLFLSELVNMCSREALPTIVGGDFNILRSPDEKNSTNYSDR
jgi:hypothetical protein